MKKRKKNYSKVILTYMLAFALCVTMFPVETRNVKHAAAESAVVIASGTYVRKSATKIVINYYSNSAGTLYYKVYSTDTTLTSDELVTNGSEYGTAVVENKINQVTLEEANEMYSGEKYVLLCVKDSEGNLSNVLKIKVEYDVCINEDFDIYKYDNTSAFYANNSSTYDFVEDPSDSTNYVYRINGDNRNNCGVGVIENSKDTIVLEGRIYSGNNLPSFGFGISACTSSYWNEWYNDRAGVVVDNGVWKSHATAVEDTVLTNLSETTAQGNTWYTIRIVYDYSRNLYDVFVNGEKANDEPIQGYSGNSNAGVYLKSSTGQNTYFDDITQYNLKSTNGSVVEFSSDSMTYTKPQTITLSTPLKGRDIYYTTDGTYPDMNSNLYADGVDIDNTTTIRAVGYYNGKEESIATEETYTFTGAPLIKSESFYRNNATTVNMVIRGDVNGTFYYMVTSLEGSYTAEEIVSSGTEYTGTTHKENTVSMLKLTDSNGISTGEKFVYVCLKDDDGTLSNVLTFDFKHDIYYSDTFETFIAGSNVNENEFFGENGESYGYALDPSDSDNIAFRSVGTNRPVRPIGLVGSTADTVIVDAKIMSDSDDAFFNYGIAGVTSSYWNEWYYDRAGIVYENGVWKSRATNRDDVILTGFENLTVLKDTWYNVRFIYDVNKNVYDIYINGIRGNEESIAGGNGKGNAGIFMTSIAGQSLYLDDVEAYCLSSTDGSIVNFSPESISVTKAQQIKLSTAASGKNIYYTTDGTYPTSESTKYTEEFTVDKTTTVRALAYCDSKAESVAYEETYTFSDKPEISSESWYRSSETAFAAKLMSTVAGTYYYKVTSADKTFTAEEIVSEGTEYTSATQEENAIMNLSLDSNAGIFAGEKHISLCLKDKDGTLSNVIKFDVMHDRQFSEDFEIYTENTTSGGYYPYASGRYYYTTDPNDSDNMVYALSGTDRPVSMVRLTGSERDTFVMEGSFTSNSDSANMGIGIAGLTSWRYGEWNYDRAGVAVVNGEWMSRVTNKDDEPLTNMVGEKVKANTKYTVRIVYDISKNLFDVYVDGKKANDEPIEGGNGKEDAAIFFTSSTGQITYFDDIEGYCLKKTADSVVEFSPTSMTMTKEKEIELSTILSGRDIYYTTDGSYPDSSDNKYEEAIKVDSTTTIRAVGYFNGKVESIAYSETYTMVDKPEIRGSNVCRSSATTAESRIYSTVAGELYYIIGDEVVTDGEAIVSEGVKSEVIVAENDTSNLKITEGLKSTSKYLNVVLKDEDGTLSNVLNIEMPYDIYLYEDFETYNENTALNESKTLISHNYPGSVYQDTDSKALYNGNGNCSGSTTVGIGEIGIHVLKFKMKSNSENAVTYVRLTSSSNYYDYTVAGITVSDGIWYSSTGRDAPTTALDSAPAFVANVWHTVRIEYSTKTNTFDVYIDDVKANSSTLTGTTYGITCLRIGFGSGSKSMVDDIEYYIQPYTVDKPTAVTEDLVYNGSKQKGVDYDEETSAYTAYNVEEKNAGNYIAKFDLEDGYSWSDGTRDVYEIPWTIAKKDLTFTASVPDKTYDGTTDVTVYKGDFTGIVEGDEENLTIVEESVKGKFADAYVGENKAITLDSNFTLSGSAKDNYTLQEAGYTGNIVAAKQKLYRGNSITCIRGETVAFDDIMAEVTGAFGEPQFMIESGQEYGSITARGLETTGVEGEDVSIAVKVTVVEEDVNEDGKVEYLANSQGVVIIVNVMDKYPQEIEFIKSVVNVEYGSDNFTINPVGNLAEGSTIKYSSSDSEVATVDENTGEISIVGLGSATIKATASETALYSGTSAEYKINVKPGKLDAPIVTATNETIKGKCDGTITGITTEMEYKKVTDEEYTAVTKGAITDLSPATYQVRYAAKYGYNASADTDVTVLEGDYIIVRFMDGEIEYTGLRQKHEYSGVLTKPEDPTKKGYEFVGWYLDKDFETVCDYDDFHVVEDVFVYSKWEKIPEPTPTPTPTLAPTEEPTEEPTLAPTEEPTVAPTVAPTEEPTVAPTEEPTIAPTEAPTEEPTAEPTVAPSVAPTAAPSAVPTAEPAPTPNALEENVPVAQKEQIILTADTDKDDVENSKYNRLLLRGTLTKESIKLTWQPVTGATGYILYGSKCGTKMQKIEEITDPNAAEKEVTGLSKGTYYKYLIVSYKTVGSETYVISTSKTVHITTLGGKRGNPLGVKVNRRTLNVKVTATGRIKAKLRVKKRTKVAYHTAKIRFESADPSIAVVSNNGTVVGTAKGSTVIYAYAQNGLYATVKVNVK